LQKKPPEACRAAHNAGRRNGERSDRDMPKWSVGTRERKVGKLSTEPKATVGNLSTVSGATKAINPNPV